MTYATAMQNYALVAPVGLPVYAIWMSRSSTRRETMRGIAIGLVAVCLIGIPFLLLYVYPNRQLTLKNVYWAVDHSAPFAVQARSVF